MKTDRLLIDQFHTQKPLDIPEVTGRDLLKYFKSHTYTVKRFVFDDEASFHLGEVVRDFPQLLAENMLALKACFPQIYIEFNAREAFRGRGGEVSRISDKRIGYTLVDDIVLILASMDTDEDPNNQYSSMIIPCPWGFKFWRSDKTPSFAQASEGTKLKMSYIFGGQRQQNKNGVQDIVLPKVDCELATHIASNTELVEIIKLPDELAVEHIFAAGGDPLIYTAAIMMLNERSKHTVIMEKSASRTMYKGKSVAIPEHSTVSIHFDKSSHANIRYLVTSHAGSPKREHDVRGHWVYYGEQECVHTWTPLSPENTKQFICPTCKGHKTWRIAHQRGDAALGTVRKTYIVKN